MKVILIWKIIAILVTDKELIFLIYKDIPESIRKKQNVQLKAPLAISLPDLAFMRCWGFCLSGLPRL